METLITILIVHSIGWVFALVGSIIFWAYNKDEANSWSDSKRRQEAVGEAARLVLVCLVLWEAVFFMLIQQIWRDSKDPQYDSADKQRIKEMEEELQRTYVARDRFAVQVIQLREQNDTLRQLRSAQEQGFWRTGEWACGLGYYDSGRSAGAVRELDGQPVRGEIGAETDSDVVIGGNFT